MMRVVLWRIRRGLSRRGRMVGGAGVGWIGWWRRWMVVVSWWRTRRISVAAVCPSWQRRTMGVDMVGVVAGS